MCPQEVTARINEACTKITADGGSNTITRRPTWQQVLLSSDLPRHSSERKLSEAQYYPESSLEVGQNIKNHQVGNFSMSKPTDPRRDVFWRRISFTLRVTCDQTLEIYFQCWNAWTWAGSRAVLLLGWRNSRMFFFRGFAAHDFIINSIYQVHNSAIRQLLFQWVKLCPHGQKVNLSPKRPHFHPRKELICIAGSWLGIRMFPQQLGPWVNHMVC